MAASKDKKTTASKANMLSDNKAEAAVTPAPQVAASGALTASSLPAADALKLRFKAGSIPLQSDFSDLIDMANAGAKAAGQAAGQSSAGKGMRLSGSGQLEPDINSFNFKNDENGCSPVVVNTDTNQIVVDLDVGLAQGTSGLGVKAGHGITVNGDGVSVDLKTVLPRGIITMFSGNHIPDGWYFCDGTNGPPDLRDRFIMGGFVEDNGGKSSTTFSGKKNNKSVSLKSESTTVTVKGNTEGHSLTEHENGPHGHEQGETLNYESMCHNGATYDESKRTYVNGGGEGYPSSLTYRPYTFSSGAGAPHAHAINLTSDYHQHDIKLVVPYYILAFIMKS